MIFFKVVLEQFYDKIAKSRELTSSNGALPFYMRVVYTPLKTAYPPLKNSKLMVFDTLDNACKFLNAYYLYNNAHEIWEAETSNPKCAETMLNIVTELDAQRFWAGELFMDNVVRAPVGTFFCDSIKLIRKAA
jgi:hypothetical protein